MIIQRLKVGLLILLCLAVVWGARGVAGERPNVILMMADDMGWGDAGYQGHPAIQTPHLDRMAGEGIRFDRFYSAAPVCSPTRGSALTGRHPYRYGIYTANSGHMKPQETTIAEVLQSQGYATGHFGKWHLGTLTTEIKDSNRGRPGVTTHYSPPWENGFDVCFSTEAKVPTFDPMIMPAGDAPRIGWDALKESDPFEEYGTYYWTGPDTRARHPLDGDDSRLIMDRALAFVEGAVRNEQSFFAVIWFHAPHLPVVAGPEQAKLYSEWDDYTKNYYGCITALDEQIGRLRERLNTWNAAENTMVWFCSDNGPEGDSSAPGKTNGLRGRKRSLHEGGVRVPGLLVWPNGVSEARTVAIPCVTSDYFPTILDVLGMKPDRTPIDGISLLPWIQGSTKPRPLPIGFQSRNQRALIGDRYKIYSGNAGEDWELYDLVQDPRETRDLSGELPERLREMKAAFQSWQASCERSDQGADDR